MILIHKNVTGVLGKEAVLQCEYTGMEEVSYSTWFTKTDTTKVKVAGYNTKSYVKNKRFSFPQSNKNLTVKINRTQLEDEKIYICAFSTDSEEQEETLYLTVLGKTFLQILYFCVTDMIFFYTNCLTPDNRMWCLKKQTYMHKPQPLGTQSAL